MLPTLAIGGTDFGHLLDLAPANDVDAPKPALRAVASFTVRAALGGDSEDNLFADLGYDVADGGVFVATYDPPPVGAVVDVTLTLPGDRELSLSGTVRFIRDAAHASDGLPAGCGIEWKDLPVEAACALDAFARTREPLLYVADAA